MSPPRTSDSGKLSTNFNLVWIFGAIEWMFFFVYFSIRPNWTSYLVRKLGWQGWHVTWTHAQHQAGRYFQSTQTSEIVLLCGVYKKSATTEKIDPHCGQHQLWKGKDPFHPTPTWHERSKPGKRASISVCGSNTSLPSLPFCSELTIGLFCQFATRSCLFLCIIFCFIFGVILFRSSYHFLDDPIKQYPRPSLRKKNRLVGKMWSSFRWIVKLVKFIRADSWGSDESKHETLLGEDCGGGRFDLWNRKGGVELSWVSG